MFKVISIETKNVVSGIRHIEYADGSSYDGGLKDGEKHGYGVLRTVKDGKDDGEYIGWWLNDERDGEAIVICSNGATIFTNYKENKMLSGGKYFYENKSYTVRIKNGEVTLVDEKEETFSPAYIQKKKDDWAAKFEATYREKTS